MFRGFASAIACLMSLAAGASPLTQQIGASRIALATVVDNRGRSIVDIEPDDFVVRETGQSRDVLSIRIADYPIAVVMDNGRGAGGDFAVIREAVERFVGRVGLRPVGLALADPPQMIVAFDDDRSVLVERLANAGAKPSAEGLLQAVVNAARAIQEIGAPFSAIVVVSSAPIGSVPNEVLTPILESGATVHVVVNRALSGGSEESSGRSSETLRILAEQTKGLFTPIYSPSSYRIALDRLADRLAPELMIEYLVPVGSASGQDVQLGVRIPGARVNGLGVSPR
jgi:hypothetical protein